MSQLYTTINGNGPNHLITALAGVAGQARGKAGNGNGPAEGGGQKAGELVVSARRQVITERITCATKEMINPV